MKKLFLIISLSLVFSFVECHISSAQELVQPYNKIIYDYIYGELTKTSNEIDLLAKTILIKDLNITKENTDDYLQRIDYGKSEVSYLISQINNKINSNKNDSNTLDGLYAITLILEEFRYAYTLLNNYLLSNSNQDKYYYIQSFFIINSQANTKLNAAKLQLPNQPKN